MSMNRNSVEWIGRPGNAGEEEQVAEVFVVDEAGGGDAEMDQERWDGLS